MQIFPGEFFLRYLFVKHPLVHPAQFKCKHYDYLYAAALQVEI